MKFLMKNLWLMKTCISLGSALKRQMKQDGVMDLFKNYLFVHYLLYIISNVNQENLMDVFGSYVKH